MGCYSAPSAFSPAEAEGWSTGVGCPLVFGRDTLDSMDGCAVEGTARRIRLTERRASTLMSVGERRHAAELVALRSRTTQRNATDSLERVLDHSGAEEQPTCHASRWTETPSLQEALENGAHACLAAKLPTSGGSLRAAHRELPRLCLFILCPHHLTKGLGIGSSLRRRNPEVWNRVKVAGVI
jgi:hypothetical protein